MAAKGVVLEGHCMRVDETIHYKTVFIQLNTAVLIIFLTFPMRRLFQNHIS